MSTKDIPISERESVTGRKVRQSGETCEQVPGRTIMQREGTLEGVDSK